MKKNLFNKFIDNVKTIFYALIIALIIRSLLIQPFYIPSSSMEPTLLIGDRIFVTKYSYGYSNHSFPFSPPIFKSRLLNQKPTRGDLVVFKTPADNRTDYIKRLIGLPGDTIQFINGKTIGHNTDWIGFSKSIKPLLGDKKTALILGNGGGAKAIKFALNKLNIKHKTVSRNTAFDYSDVTTKTIDYYSIIINTTPLGTHPKIHEFPKINYTELNSKNLLFDLIYNPNESRFLQYGKTKGSEIKNGLEMLQIQAEESWNIWNL